MTIPARADDARVSVVITCFNQAHFLGDALRSVRAQSCRTVEIIVVNDGSTDDTAVVLARQPDVIAIHQANAGSSRARNAGLRRASGEFVLFLDGDDCLLPHAIDVLQRELAADAALAFVSGRSQYMSADGTPIEWSQPLAPGDDRHAALLRSAHIWMPGSVLFRRSILLDCDGFRDGVGLPDYELYLRLSAAHPCREVDAVVALYRRHGHNMSNDDVAMLRYCQTVLRAFRPGRGSNRWRDYLEGRANTQNYYGRRAVRQAAVRLATRRWGAAAAALATLARWYPAGFARFLRGIRVSAALPFVVSANGAPRTALSAPAAGGGALALVRVAPDSTMPGVGFNLQPDGSSALWIDCAHADPDTVVLFDDVVLHTCFVNDRSLTAAVPAGLIATPGDHTVRLVAPGAHG